MGKKYELDDRQADRFKKGLKVNILKVGQIVNFQSVDEWHSAGCFQNVAVLKEGFSANRQKEVLFEHVEVVWHRVPHLVMEDGKPYKVRYE